MLIRFYGPLAILTLSNLMLLAQAPKPMLKAKTEEKIPPATMALRPFVKNWKVMDIEGLLGAGLEGGRNYDKGLHLVRQATCLGCHRFNQEGSAAGPDLSMVVTKYGPLELLTHIIEPNKEIDNSYLQHEVTLKDGNKVLGRIVKLTADKATLYCNMMDTKKVQSIDRKLIKSMEPSKVSMMPSGLLDTLNEIEILDLLAYLLSKGDGEDPMFK